MVRFTNNVVLELYLRYKGRAVKNFARVGKDSVMARPKPVPCTFSDEFLLAARRVVRLGTVAVQTVQRFRLALLSTNSLHSATTRPPSPWAFRPDKSSGGGNRRVMAIPR